MLIRLLPCGVLGGPAWLETSSASSFHALTLACLPYIDNHLSSPPLDLSPKSGVQHAKREGFRCICFSFFPLTTEPRSCHESGAPIQLWYPCSPHTPIPVELEWSVGWTPNHILLNRVLGAQTPPQASTCCIILDSGLLDDDNDKEPHSLLPEAHLKLTSHLLSPEVPL
jgi:hypothetical protein